MKDWDDYTYRQHKAHRLVRQALLERKMERGECCEGCGVSGRFRTTPTGKRGRYTLEGHHENYDKPLEVVWLCKSCHKRADIARELREFEEKSGYVEIEVEVKYGPKTVVEIECSDDMLRAVPSKRKESMSDILKAMMRYVSDHDPANDP
jgi:hypothetical protein